jgi:hypothetical protein
MMRRDFILSRKKVGKLGEGGQKQISNNLTQGVPPDKSPSRSILQHQRHILLT